MNSPNTLPHKAAQTVRSFLLPAHKTKEENVHAAIFFAEYETPLAAGAGYAAGSADSRGNAPLPPLPQKHLMRQPAISR